MTEANLAIARKVVLCAGLLASVLLFMYPHWLLSVYPGNGSPSVNQDVGRAFIVTPPVFTAHSPEFTLIENKKPASPEVTLMEKKPAQIDYVRQLTEVAIALLFTFGVMRALTLRKPAGD
jgi:hypothetical protein